MMSPRILFVHEQTQKLDYQQMSLHWQAAEAGFLAFVVSWRDISFEGGRVYLGGGYQALSREIKRYILEPEVIRPEAIVLRTFAEGGCRPVMHQLLDNFPQAWVNWIPQWQSICQKWETEMAISLADPALPRPRTFLWDRAQQNQRQKLFEAEDYLVKPSRSAQCRGIQLFAANEIEMGLEELPEGRFVIQELAGDPLLHRGRRFDLRVNVVGSLQTGGDWRVWDPVILRPAALPHLPQKTELKRILTGTSFRKRESLNWVSHKLSGADVAEDWCAEGLRSQIGPMVLRWVETYRKVTFLNRSRDLHRFFFMAGLDLLPVYKAGDPKLLFIEANYFPMLSDWGKVIDDQLTEGHPTWLAWLKNKLRKGRGRAKGAG